MTGESGIANVRMQKMRTQNKSPTTLLLHRLLRPQNRATLRKTTPLLRPINDRNNRELEAHHKKGIIRWQKFYFTLTWDNIVGNIWQHRA